VLDPQLGLISAAFPCEDGHAQERALLGPTRDGDTELALLTDLTAAQADALTLARLYLERWQIETAFAVLTETLHGEQPRLGYPKAALFAFCVTLVAYNVLAVIKAAPRAAHGPDKVEQEVSLSHVTEEVRRTHAGMMIAIPPREWLPFRGMSARELADALRRLAGHVDLAKYKKAPTRPKRPAAPRTYDRTQPHVSTARALAERRRR
jgi:hypothetical protein